VLQAAGLATLLFDLLTRREELDRATVFDVGLLAGRLIEVTSWVRAHPQCRGLRVGYFGASTGAAAALWAATTDPAVAAVVSRGGRLDPAAPCLEQVRAATLLVVGGRDAVVLEVRVGQQQRDGLAAKVPRRLGCAPAAAALRNSHDRVTSL
jgi:putative phosphoribosyl transferase